MLFYLQLFFLVTTYLVGEIAGNFCDVQYVVLNIILLFNTRQYSSDKKIPKMFLTSSVLVS